MKAEDVLRAALSLPVGQRADLAAELLASLEDSDDDPEILAAEWAEELDRRVETVLASEASRSRGRSCASASLTNSPGEPSGSRTRSSER